MLYPMLILIIWTILVCSALGIMRFLAVRKGEVNPRQYSLMSGYEEPKYLKKLNRHYLNLLEQPVLFYLACVLVISLGMQTDALVILSWSYLAIRFLHSFIHMGYNNSLHRMAVFTVSMLVLLTIWIILALGLTQMTN